MSEKAIKTWLDIAPEYVDFLLKFVRRPPVAFENRFTYGKISSDLTSILMGGIALSYVLILVAGSPQLQNDSSEMAKLMRGLAARDLLLLPAVAYLCILGFAIFCHVLGKAVTLVFSIDNTSQKLFGNLSGSVEDSVNAALGFTSVYIPLFAAVLCVATWLPLQIVSSVGVSLAFVPGIFPFIYYPWSLSATHCEIKKGYQAFCTLCLGFGPFFLLFVGWLWLTSD